VVTEDEGDEEGANDSSGGDRQGGDRQNRVSVGQDRQRDETDGNSRPIRRQGLGGGGNDVGKPGIPLRILT
jgi:hypothetical protein